MTEPTHDYRKKFIFEDLNIRGEICQLSDTLRAVFAKHQHPDNIRQILAETLLVNTLIASSLKYAGELSIQLQSTDDYIAMLMSECNHLGHLRVVARLRPELSTNSSSLHELIPNGRCAITLMPEQGQRYQGVIALSADTIADNIADYFQQSEQLPTLFYLFFDAEKMQGCGLLIQQLPATTHTPETSDDDSWQRISVLSESLTQAEALFLPVETLLMRLFHEENVRHFPATPIAFQCKCSKERVARALLTLGEAEVQAMIAEDTLIKSQCEFCLHEYIFDADAVDAMFNSQSYNEPSSNSLH